MVSLCSHMTDGASSLQRRAFGNGRKGGEEDEEEKEEEEMEEEGLVGVHRARGSCGTVYR